jgi:hypothetical protein
MRTPAQAEALPLAPPAEQVEAARRFMLDSLVNRGFPVPDAEDAIDDVLQSIEARPESFLTCLASVHDHGACLATVALDAYLVRLEAERRRRGDQDICSCFD